MTKKTPNFRRDFGQFVPNLHPQNFIRGFFLYLWLDIVPSYHPMQCTGKLMNETWENDKQPNFGPDLGLFWSKFDFTSTRC